MKKLTMQMIPAIALACSGQASAYVYCVGRISEILTEASGAVMVLPTFRNDWLQVCNLTGPWKGVPVDVCKSWVGTLTTVRITQDLSMFYYDAESSCSSIPSYANASSPGYIRISPP